MAAAVTLTARADRIDVMANGQLAILDYKTGTVPSRNAVKDGHKPQLALEAAMAARGAFAGLAARRMPRTLAYWQLNRRAGAGRGASGQHRARRDRAARAGGDGRRWARWPARFLLGAAAFTAWPHPGREPAGDDYATCRAGREWAGAEDAADG